MNTPQRRLVGFALILELGLGLGAAAGIGCSSGSPAGGGSGGNTSSGGSSGSGGSSASGGTTGSGGASASGGQTGSGGTTSSGGTSASGGTTGSGGNSASGGATATGSGGSASGGGAGSTSNGGTSGGEAGRMGGGAGRMGMGGGGRNGSGAGGASTIPATMTLTSPVLMEGGMFPANITCADSMMGSPELDWTPGPAGTMSYAIELTDTNNNLAHWMVWDIPVPSGSPAMITLKAMLATTTTLTDPAGAKQASAMGTGYLGPCPSGMEHIYQFSVYAIPTATLQGNTSNSTMARASARAAAIATGSLKGTSSAKRP